MNPDGWLRSLDGLHLERTVDKHGMVSIDLKRYDVSTKLTGQRIGLHVDADECRVHMLYEQHRIKTVPLRGLVGQMLSFEQFLIHMQRQARAQARLRSLQEHRYRTSP